MVNCLMTPEYVPAKWCSVLHQILKLNLQIAAGILGEGEVDPNTIIFKSGKCSNKPNPPKKDMSGKTLFFCGDFLVYWVGKPPQWNVQFILSCFGVSSMARLVSWFGVPLVWIMHMLYHAQEIHMYLYKYIHYTFVGTCSSNKLGILKPRHMTIYIQRGYPQEFPNPLFLTTGQASLVVFPA